MKEILFSRDFESRKKIQLPSPYIMDFSSQD